MRPDTHVLLALFVEKFRTAKCYPVMFHQINELFFSQQFHFTCWLIFIPLSKKMRVILFNLLRLQQLEASRTVAFYVPNKLVKRVHVIGSFKNKIKPLESSVKLFDKTDINFLFNVLEQNY